MVFQYQPGTGFNFMKEFAERFHLSHSENLLEFDSFIGKGFIKTIDIMPDFRTVICNIDYRKSLIVKKMASEPFNDIFVFRFMYVMASDRIYLSNMQVINNLVDTEDNIDANTKVCYVVISMKASRLLDLLDLGKDMGELASFISGFDKPFLHQEAVTPEIKNIIRELSEHTYPDKLEKLYYKTKTSELIYEFFSRFLKRATFDFSSVNKGDIEKILRVERIILKDLSHAPVLPELARTIGMSETKMKSIFKKVFEDTIYNYYSSARMIEAASMLKNNRDIPVSEVGYSLGFSNLSHFSKMFKRYIGMKPKEYAMEVKKMQIIQCYR